MKLNEWINKHYCNEITPFLPTENDKPLVLFNLSDWGLVSVLGQNAAQFLQGQATCDMRKVTPQRGQLGGFCDYKGRLFAIFYVFQWQNHYYLWMPKEIIENTIKQLNKYALLSKVTLQDVSNNFSTLGLTVNNSTHNLNSIIPQLPDQLFTSQDNNDICMLRVSDSSPRFLLTGESDKLQKEWERLKPFAHLTNDNYWKLINIRNSLPFIYPTSTGQYMPHQMNLPENNGVSFDKGCYTGQEIVARLHYKGKLKQHLVRVSATADKIPLIGENLFIKINHNSDDKKIVGQVVMVAQSNENQFEMLVIIDESARKLDIYLQINEIKKIKLLED